MKEEGKDRSVRFGEPVVKHIISSLMLLLSGFALGEAVDFEKYDGLVFSQAGPNCFGSALKLAGHYPTFRGVDADEFQAFLDLACTVTENPKRGDIGVYVTPGFGPIHAFIYVNETVGMDKPGVDYMGKTPVSLRPYERIDYHFLAPPECRRYSPKDLSLCSNQKIFYSCDLAAMNLRESVNDSVVDYQSDVLKFERKIAALLNQARVSQMQKEELAKELDGLKSRLEEISFEKSLSEAEISYLHFQLESLRDQIAFLR